MGCCLSATPQPLCPGTTLEETPSTAALAGTTAGETRQSADLISSRGGPPDANKLICLESQANLEQVHSILEVNKAPELTKGCELEDTDGRNEAETPVHQKDECARGNDPNSTDSFPPRLSPRVLEGRVKLSLLPGEDRPKENCPYCDTAEGDHNDLLVLHQEVSPGFIEDLMGHGWWRTGNVLYRPRQQTVCCPSLTLRTDVRQFRFAKSHRRVLRKFADFLSAGSPKWPPPTASSSQQEAVGGVDRDLGACTHTDGFEGDESGRHDNSTVEECSVAVVAGSKRSRQEESGRGQQGAECKRRQRRVNPGLGPDPSKMPCRKAKLVRRELRQGKAPSPGDEGGGSEKVSGGGGVEHIRGQLQGASLREMVVREQSQASPKHRWEVQLHPVRPPSLQMERTKQESFRLYERFQERVHPGKVRFEDFSQFVWGFCDSCMVNEVEGPRLQGTFHQQYYLDDRLVAVSVIDILPTYFVSIYLYYDPDLRFAQPGIYTVLRELDFVQELRKSQPSLCYYDLGYYNRLSPKVSYKDQFRPAQVLCPFTLHWCDLAGVETRLLPHTCPLLSDRRRHDDGEDDEVRMRAAVEGGVVLLGPRAVRFRDLPEGVREAFRDKMEILYHQTGVDMMSKFIVVVR